MIVILGEFKSFDKRFLFVFHIQFWLDWKIKKEIFHENNVFYNHYSDAGYPILVAVLNP